MEIESLCKFPYVFNETKGSILKKIRIDRVKVDFNFS